MGGLCNKIPEYKYVFGIYQQGDVHKKKISITATTARLGTDPMSSSVIQLTGFLHWNHVSQGPGIRRNHS